MSCDAGTQSGAKHSQNTNKASLKLLCVHLVTEEL